VGNAQRLPSTDAEVISESPMRNLQPASSPPFATPPFATPSQPTVASYNLALLDDASLLSFQYIPLLDPKIDQRMLTLQVMPPGAFLVHHLISHPAVSYAQLLCSKETKPYSELQEETFK
jgi:hypothetical protein